MKRLSALILCLVMYLSLIPAAAAEGIAILGFEDAEEDPIAVIDPTAAAEAAPEAEPADKYTVTNDSGRCGDNLNWEYSGNTLTISGTGDMWDYADFDEKPWYNFDYDIRRIVIQSGVTGIGSHAFSYSGASAGVSIADSVTRIGDWSFAGVDSSVITLPKNLKSIGDHAFSGCWNLTDINLPSSLTSIGSDAFFRCEALKTVTLPSGLKSIGDCAFWYCSSFGDLTIPASVTSIGDGAFAAFSDKLTAIKVNSGNANFCSVDGVLLSKDKTTLVAYPTGKQGSYTIPSSVTKIRDRAFQLSQGLTGVTVPSGVTSIGVSVFGDCYHLTSITLPDSITSFGREAFCYCNNLTSLKLPANLVSIGDYALLNTALETLTIPAKVKSIGEGAFHFLLETVYFKGAAPSFGENCFDMAEATVYYPKEEPSWTSAVRQDYGGTLNWVSYGVSPTVTTQPKSQSVAEGGTAKFSVTAACARSYQWQYRTSSNGSWNNCSNGSSATLSVEAKAYRSGYQYRCKVTNSTGSTTSGTATLTVTVAKPSITTQPKSQSAAAGSTVKFSVAASGATGYQWQYRTSSSGSWNNSTASSAKSATLSVTAETYRSGYQYRCKVSNSAGAVYSNAATLTVTSASKPTITTQPKSQSAAAGSTVKFSVTASGATSYQWQYRTSSNGEWKNSTASSAKSATLSITAESYRSGYQYRCKATNSAGTTTSNAATLTVIVKPTITTQPFSKSAYEGDTVKFTVKAEGTGLSYQWYYRTGSSGSWNKCSGTGAATASLSVEAKAYRNGYQYRCKVWNSAGEVYTNTVTLTVK